MRVRALWVSWSAAAAASVVVALLSSCSGAPDPAPPPAAPAAPAPANPPAQPVQTPPAPLVLPKVVSRPAGPAGVEFLAGKADVVVADMASPYPVSVTVGQTVGIVWPGGTNIWQVDFPPDELTLLTPMKNLSTPGKPGWVWRAAKAGDVEIVLTARTPCPNPPCGENPARYTVTMKITSRS